MDNNFYKTNELIANHKCFYCSDELTASLAKDEKFPKPDPSLVGLFLLVFFFFGVDAVLSPS